MKKLFGLLVILVVTASCAQIEQATSKWKTPENSEAGLAPGEKSNYLLDKQDQKALEEPFKTKKTKKKAIKR